MKHRFEQTPHELLLDRNVSIGARALYPLLCKIAWDAGRREPEDAVELPPLSEIAETFGCATSTVRVYVGELRATGWVETIRAHRSRPSQWILREDPRAPKSGARDGVPSAEIRRSRAPKSGAPSISVQTSTDGETTSPLTEDSDPPPIMLIDGRNLPLDALAEVCGIDQASPRFPQAVAALQGRGRKPGIRHLFWRECVRYADEHQATDELPLLFDDPERFVRGLERAIRRKAAVYRQALRGATMTPTALLSWWLDLERQADAGGAMTPEQMENAR